MRDASVVLINDDAVIRAGKMDSTHPTAGWEKVGDRFYRKTQLYTAVFDLDLDLDSVFVAGALYGGAVGVYNFNLALILILILISIRTLHVSPCAQWCLSVPSLQDTNISSKICISL